MRVVKVVLGLAGAVVVLLALALKLAPSDGSDFAEPEACRVGQSWNPITESCLEDEPPEAVSSSSAPTAAPQPTRLRRTPAERYGPVFIDEDRGVWTDDDGDGVYDDYRGSMRGSTPTSSILRSPGPTGTCGGDNDCGGGPYGPGPSSADMYDSYNEVDDGYDADSDGDIDGWDESYDSFTGYDGVDDGADGIADTYEGRRGG